MVSKARIHGCRRGVNELDAQRWMAVWQASLTPPDRIDPCQADCSLLTSPGATQMSVYQLSAQGVDSAVISAQTAQSSVGVSCTTGQNWQCQSRDPRGVCCRLRVQRATHDACFMICMHRFTKAPRRIL